MPIARPTNYGNYVTKSRGPSTATLLMFLLFLQGNIRLHPHVHHTPYFKIPTFFLHPNLKFSIESHDSTRVEKEEIRKNKFKKKLLRKQPANKAVGEVVGDSISLILLIFFQKMKRRSLSASFL